MNDAAKERGNLPAPSVQGDDWLEGLGYVFCDFKPEYGKPHRCVICGESKGTFRHTGKTAIQAQVDEAETSGAIKMLDSLYKGGYIGQWDYDRIRHELTTQPEPSKEGDSE